MKIIAALLFTLVAFSSNAQALTQVTCEIGPEQNVPFSQLVLKLKSSVPTGDENGSDWLFTIAGKKPSDSRIKVVRARWSGPRRRPGIDGYEVIVQKPGSPFNPRKVYSLFTRLCAEEGLAYLYLKSGAGSGRDRPLGPEVECQCR